MWRVATTLTCSTWNNREGLPISREFFKLVFCHTFVACKCVTSTSESIPSSSEWIQKMKSSMLAHLPTSISLLEHCEPFFSYPLFPSQALTFQRWFSGALWAISLWHDQGLSNRNDFGISDLNAQTHLQSNSSARRLTMFGATQNIYQKWGVRGYFRGITAVAAGAGARASVDCSLMLDSSLTCRVFFIIWKIQENAA